MKARRLQRVALLASVGMAMASPAPALAGDPPFSGDEISLVARDREVSAFVQEFFSAAGLSATVDPQIGGRVNGRFTGSPAMVWRQLSSAFNMVAYYDGSVVRVYPASEVRSESVNAPDGQARELASAIRAAGLPDRQNRVRVTSSANLMITGVPRFLEQVRQLAGNRSGVARSFGHTMPPQGTASARPNDTGQQLEPYELRVFYLQYARADSTLLSAGGREVLVPGVGATVSRIMGDGEPVRGDIAATYNGRTLRQSQPRLGGRGLDSVPPGPGQAPADDDYLGLPRVTPVPVNDTSPRRGPAGPRIAVDPSLNAVIVRDRPENMPAYEGLVEALDLEPQIVELEATIIDLNIDRLRELGIDWRIRSEGFNAVFGGDIVRRSGIPMQDIQTTGSVNRGLSLRGVIGSNQELIGRLNALEQKGAARVVSRPQLVTLSNIEAVFDRTRTFYVRVAGDRQVDLFNVTAGTVLRVTPHVITDDGASRIRMVIEVEDGSVLDSEVDDIPVVERASVNTQALINEGEGLLLGGLTVNAEFDAESGIPILKDIPVVGNLFKTTSRRRQRIERLFLITPRLVGLDDAARADRAEANQTPAKATSVAPVQASAR